jgi:cytosine/adenosine deaminase-related metal-dependent hydrolase
MQDMSTTVIKNAAWVVAWDAALGHHAYCRGVDLAFSDDRIVFLGRDFDKSAEGPADRVIDGSTRFVLPGLIDIHSHPEHEPLYRGIREEHGLPSMHMTGLYERSQALSATDDEARAASAEFAYCELLLSGVTSLVDISPPWPGWVELFAKSGLRGFLAPGYASARWYLEDDHELHYAWDEARGRAGFTAALGLIDAALAHPCGRLSGVVSPMQIDTCTADLLKDSRAAARDRGLPFTLHVAQSVSEVREMIRRHGQTPVQWAQAQGLLGPGTILGHALFLDHHSWIRGWTTSDLAILGDSGTAVAHCPTPFARYGQTMENFGDYLRAGVTMGSAPIAARTTSSRRCARPRCWPASRRATSRRSPQPICSMPPRWVGRVPCCATISAGSRWARRPTSSWSTSTVRRCSRRATRCAPLSITRPTGRCARCSSTGGKSSRTGGWLPSTRPPPASACAPRNSAWRPPPPAATTAAAAPPRSRR